MKNKNLYLWGFIGRIGPQVITLIANMILARFLSPEDFGMIGVLSVFFLIANTLMESGLGGSLIKEKTITSVDLSTIFVYNIFVSICIYLLIYFLSPKIEYYFAINGLSKICRCVCLVFVIASWGQIPQTILLREFKFKLLTISSIISVILASILSILQAFWDYGVWALVNFQLAQTACTVILNIIFSKYKFSFRFCFKSFKKLFSFGFFTTASSVIDTLYENIITFLFGRYLSIQKAGYLTQAKKVETAACNVFVSTINTVAFPILVRLHERGKSEFIQEAHSLLRTSILTIFPLMLLMGIYSTEIVALLFGKNWIFAGPYLNILTFVGIAMIIESLTRNYLKSAGFVNQIFTITIIKRLLAIGVIVCVLLLNKNWLLYGYLIGAIIGALSNYIVFIIKFTITPIAEFFFFLRYCLPVVILFLAIYSVKYSFPEIKYNIPIILFLLSCYYLLTMRMLGVDIKKLK